MTDNFPIQNPNCAYCNCPLTSGENDTTGRSKEHFIPRVAVRVSRTKGDYDFYACRRCNSDKSEMDEMIGLFSRISNAHLFDKDAVDKIINRVTKKNKKFQSIFRSSKIKKGEVSVKLPFRGKQVYEYGVFLAKGEYLKQQGKIFDKNQNLVLVKWIGNEATNKIMENYTIQNQGSDPFKDLSVNPEVQNFNEEIFLISGIDGSDFGFIFNKTFIILVYIIENTPENKKLVKENIKNLNLGFSKGHSSKYMV